MKSSSIILGIGGSSHDFSACLLKDGKIIIGIEQERLDRVKHSAREWHSEGAKDAVDYCLKSQAINIKDISLVMHANDIATLPSNIQGVSSFSIGHHLAHAACSYYHSPYKDAAILVIDGHGQPIKSKNTYDHMETISHGKAQNGEINLRCIQTGPKKISSASWTYITANSLGSFYKVVSDLIGFGLRGSGKIMGLSAYGSQRFLDDLREFAHHSEDGGFFFDPYGGIVEFINSKMSLNANSAQAAADLAFAAQTIFEDAVVYSANILQKETGSKTLCYGGGCALNGLANQRIIDQTDFERMFVHPACGDAGLSVGAALWGWYNKMGKEKDSFCGTSSDSGAIAYIGKEYSNQEIEDALQFYPVLFSKPEDILKNIICRLLKGEIGALFIGGSEIGPRALGHRSIIADPGYPNIKQKINRHVKYRESFRPLAPVVPYEKVSEYFHFIEESPFMLRIAMVQDQWMAMIQGAIHIDGSTRLQTLKKPMNPFLYDLLIEFERFSGYAVLTNTSFNRKDEPIVETPLQAVDNFIKMKLDFLYIDGYLVEKHSPWLEE